MHEALGRLSIADTRQIIVENNILSKTSDGNENMMKLDWFDVKS